MLRFIRGKQCLFSFLILLGFGLLSCNNSTTQEVETYQADSLYKDPLFFIDGQLCQHARVMHTDRQGRKWIGSNVYGILCYAGDSLIYYNHKNAGKFGRITSILEDDAGALWFATANGLVKFENQKFTLFNTDEVTPEIWGMFQDTSGVFWLAALNGIYKYDGSVYQSFPIPKAAVSDTNTILNYDRVCAIMQSRDGSIWMGTDGFGICRYFPVTDSFALYSTEDGLSDNNISQLVEDDNGVIWIGTMYGGLNQYRNGVFTPLDSSDGINGIEVDAIYQDQKQQIWVAIEHQGIYRFNEQGVRHYSDPDGLASTGILFFHEDKDNQFWLGGWGGVFRMMQDRFVPVTKDGPWK